MQFPNRREQAEARERRMAEVDLAAIRQFVLAVRDERMYAIFLYLIFITAPVTLPLFVRAIRRERQAVREVVDVVGLPEHWPYSDQRAAVAELIAATAKRRV